MPHKSDKQPSGKGSNPTNLPQIDAAILGLWEVWDYCCFVRRKDIHASDRHIKQSIWEIKNRPYNEHELNERKQSLIQYYSLYSDLYGCPLKGEPTTSNRFTSVFREIENLETELRAKNEQAHSRIFPIDKSDTQEVMVEDVLNELGIPALERKQKELEDSLSDIFWNHQQTLEKLGPYLREELRKPITRREAEQSSQPIKVLKKRLAAMEVEVLSVGRRQKLAPSSSSRKKLSEAEVFILIRDHPEWSSQKLASETGWNAVTLRRGKWRETRIRAKALLPAGELTPGIKKDGVVENVDHTKGKRVIRKPNHANES